MTDAIRDGNRVPVALGVSTADATVTTPFKVDPATGKLQTSGAGAGIYAGADIVVATDGTGDYTTIQAALDAVGSGGDTIFVRAGTYTVTTGLKVKTSNTRLNLSGGAIVQCNGSVVPTLISPNVTGLSRIAITGGKWLQTSGSAVGTAFDFSDTADNLIAPTRIENFNIAIALSDTTDQTFYSKYQDIQVFNCNSGIVVTGVQANNNLFENIRIRQLAGGAGTGVSLSNVRGLTFINVDCEPATGTGITGVSLDSTTRECVFMNCWIENNATGINVASGATRNTFYNCSITSNLTNDIIDTGTSTVFINTNQTGNTKNQGIVKQSWLKPYQWTLVATSQTPVVGTVYLEEFEVLEQSTVDAISYVKGATQAGNVTVGIYGPVATREVCTGLALIANSVSTAVSAGNNTEQSVPLTAAVILPQGLYYAAIEFDDVTNTYQRYGNQTQVVGWTGTYARSGGYGALTTPCPTVTNTASAIPGLTIRCT